MKIKTTQLSFKKIYLTRLKRKQLSINSGCDKLLKNNIILPTINKKNVIKMPSRYKKKNWNEFFTERRQSRRLGNLPPIDVIKTEDREINYHLDNVLLNQNQTILFQKKPKDITYLEATPCVILQEENNTSSKLIKSLNETRKLFKSTENVLDKTFSKVQLVNKTLNDNKNNQMYESIINNDSELKSCLVSSNTFLKVPTFTTMPRNNFTLPNKKTTSVELKNISNSEINLSEEIRTCNYSCMSTGISESSYKGCSKVDSVNLTLGKYEDYQMYEETINNNNNNKSELKSYLFPSNTFISKPGNNLTTNNNTPSVVIKSLSNQKSKTIKQVNGNKYYQNSNFKSIQPVIHECLNDTPNKQSYSKTCEALKIHSHITRSLMPTNKSSNISEIKTSLHKTYFSVTKKKEKLSHPETHIKTTINTRNSKKTKVEKLETKKKLYQEKLIFMTILKLTPIENLKIICKKQIEDSKIVKSKKDSLYCKRPSKMNKNTHYQSSSVERSYLLDSSNKHINQKHSVQIIIPEKTSGALFHDGGICMHKCSSCHSKFGLYDTPHHIAQIKNLDKQKACLENAAQSMIGANSCLCTTCFRVIKNQCSDKYIVKNVCVVTNCKRSIYHIFKSPWLDNVKFFKIKEKINLKTWADKTKSMPVCQIHFNKIIQITECQLCGDQIMETNEVQKTEIVLFQHILNKEQMSVTLKNDSLLCKLCHVYLLQRSNKNPNLSNYTSDFIKQQDIIIKRNCAHKKLDLFSHTQKKATQETPSLQSIQNQSNFEDNNKAKSNKLVSQSEVDIQSKKPKECS